MKKLIALLLIVCMGAGLCACMPNLKKFAVEFADEKASLNGFDTESADFTAFLGKLSAFSSKLTAELYGEREGENSVCISPVALYMSLAVACEMSDGETREQILDALGMNYNELQFFTKYLYAICNGSSVYNDGMGTEKVCSEMRLASSVWFADTVALNGATNKRLAKNYNCDVFSISYENGDASKLINQYIEYKTDGLVSSDIKFSKDTAFSIISTFYLREIWNSIGRDLTLTLEEYRFTNNDESVTETFLLKGNYVKGRAYETDKYSAFFAETCGGFKIYFILPNESIRLSKMFTDKTINEVLAIDDFGYADEEALELYYTRALFPEFSASFSGDVSKLLSESFGMTDLFDKGLCDASGATPSDAYCKALMHTCEINVDAKGINNSSSVAIPGSAPQAPSGYEIILNDFVIDREFGFLIVDEYGTLLFSGAVNNLK